MAMPRERRREIGETYNHIILDEVHEFASKQFSQLLQIFKCRKITGLSATPRRTDERSRILACYVGRVVKVDDAGIIPIKFDLVKTRFYFKWDQRKKDYNKLLEVLIADEERNKLIVSKIDEYLEKGKTIFVYSRRVKHLEILKEMVDANNPTIKTGLIVDKTSYGKTISTKEQNIIRKECEEGKVKVIFGGDIIKRGFNVRPLSVGIMATPGKSPILIEQFMGREQREYPKKSEVVFVDFIDERIKTLLYQFFYKNRRIYKQYREMSFERKKDINFKKKEEQLKLELK
jgi:superfamily II DNA or RNA helicase